MNESWEYLSFLDFFVGDVEVLELAVVDADDESVSSGGECEGFDPPVGVLDGE